MAAITEGAACIYGRLNGVSIGWRRGGENGENNGVKMASSACGES
jgi:hypothetical protein